MTAATIIPKQTAAVTTKVLVNLETPQGLPASIVAVGLAGSETATISFSEDNGATFTDAIQEDDAVVLTATNNIIKVDAPVTLGITKDATVAAAGVFLFGNVKQIS